MTTPSIGSKWLCAQGGGMKITVISRNDDLNWDYDKRRMKRSGDVVYVYEHNSKVGHMKTFTPSMWNSEWTLDDEQ